MTWGTSRVGPPRRRQQQPGSLVEVFRRRAAEQGDRIAFSFLADDDAPPQDVTYSGLDRRARAIAVRLQGCCRRGDRALLVYGPGLEYVAALAGCLYAGVVAVPAYPPDPMRAARTFPRLEAIVRDAGARAVLGESSDLAWTGAMLGRIPGVECLLDTSEIDESTADDWVQPDIGPDQLALIQYTSGSTGDPKGVMIRHAHALHNLAQMHQTVDVNDAVVAMWLPAYHDMGLVGGILQCWYSGRRNVLMSPLAFFQRPLRWLQTIDRYRATTTGAPNFAYDLCVQKTTAAERRELDLSGWRLALCGAEPVRPATIDRFAEAFAVAGVRRDIFRPCYGLAEATLMVACSDGHPTICAFDAEQLTDQRAVEVAAGSAAADGSTTRKLAGCGKSVPGQRVMIVDPVSLETLPDNRVGEIWVAGGNVAAGYWNRPEETQAVFQARTADGAGPFLRTGDAGFFHRGELFISGRLKEVIIVHGRNYYPADLEHSVQACHEAFHRCAGAAFSIEVDGRERVAMVHEVARPKRFDLDDLSRLARWKVLEDHDVMVDYLVLVRQGTIPKTTSGKIQRGACRELFLSRQLEALHCWRPCQASVNADRPYLPPRTPTERLLAESWAEVLGLERVGVFDNFIELGGHSLLAAQLANRLAPRLGFELPLHELFERPTVAALAELVDARQAERLDAEAEFLDALEAMPEDEAVHWLSIAESPLDTTMPQDGTPT